DSNGNWQWTRIDGGFTNDYLSAIAIDGTAIYLNGYYSDPLNNKWIITLFKYDNNGNLKGAKLDTIQFSSNSTTFSFDMKITSSLQTIYITGTTDSSPFYGKNTFGGKDIFLLAYDFDFNFKWVELIGGANDDYGQKLFLDDTGNIYIAGHSKSSFNNQYNIGDYDIVVIKYLASVSHQWTLYKGGVYSDGGYGIVVDNESVYFAGSTKSSFDDKVNNGGYDVCILKIIQP
ncbi:MAG: SBBP repeat-containing protein, partial [Exilispira sp.]